MSTGPRRSPDVGGSLGRRAARLRLSLQVLAMVLVLQLLLRFDLSRVLGWLDVERPDSPLDAASASELVPIVNAVIAGLGPLVGSVCLTRTLTLFTFLRRRGVPLEVHLGIEQHGFDADVRFRGHCWLVYEQAPLHERSDPRERFRLLYRYFSRSNRQLNIPLEIVEEEAEEVIAAVRHVIGTAPDTVADAPKRTRKIVGSTPRREVAAAPTSETTTRP